MKRPKPPSIITVAIITTITIIFWIFFSVYQILTGEPDVEVPESLLKPLNPTLDQEVLSTLNEGVDYNRGSVVHFMKSEGIEAVNNEEVLEQTPTTSPSVTPIQIDEDFEIATNESELVE